jgi:hypothetical protein
MSRGKACESYGRNQGTGPRRINSIVRSLHRTAALVDNGAGLLPGGTSGITAGWNPSLFTPSLPSARADRENPSGRSRTDGW